MKHLKLIYCLCIGLTACGDEPYQPTQCAQRFTATPALRQAMRDDVCPHGALCAARFGQLTSVDAIKFLPVREGESHLETFTVRNTGRSALRIDSVKISDTTHFRVVASSSLIDLPITDEEDTTCIGALGPGDEASIVVEYAPKTLGSHETLLLVRSNDPSRTNAEIKITGRAASP